MPALVSAIAPVNPRARGRRSPRRALLPFAVLRCARCAMPADGARDRRGRRGRLALGIDAFVQMITGYSLAGAAEAERLSGIFGAGNLKLGPVLAVLSPFVFVAARDALGWRGLSFAFVFLPCRSCSLARARHGSCMRWSHVSWRGVKRAAHVDSCSQSGPPSLMACVAATIALHDSRGFDRASAQPARARRHRKRRR